MNATGPARALAPRDRAPRAEPVPRPPVVGGDTAENNGRLHVDDLASA